MKLTKPEKDAVISALSYYIYDATHGYEHGCCGLEDTDKEYTPLISALKKIRESITKSKR